MKIRRDILYWVAVYTHLMIFAKCSLSGVGKLVLLPLFYHFIVSYA
jgi:hypothetical protein